MKNITRILSAALALCLLAALCLPARAGGTQDCGAKLLAITFDDGPGKYTGALLDGLAERGVHATFFVNGVNASGWPETLKRIVNEGHQLANHTYNHKNLNTCSAQTVAYEISAVQALITAAGGDENAYIRAPYGNANKTVRSVVRAPLIYWSVDPEDWKYRNAETVRSNIEAGVFDGAIILVHDIYKTSVDGALAAIDDLLAEGYEFVTVKDLLLREDNFTVQAQTHLSVDGERLLSVQMDYAKAGLNSAYHSREDHGGESHQEYRTVLDGVRTRFAGDSSFYSCESIERGEAFSNLLGYDVDNEMERRLVDFAETAVDLVVGELKNNVVPVSYTHLTLPTT